MTSVGTQVAVGHSTPVAVASQETAIASMQVTIRNKGSKACFLGGPDVTSSTGYELDTTDGPVQMSLGSSGSLYAICAGTDTTTLHVLTL